MNDAVRIAIRPELQADGMAVRDLLVDAFGGPAEAALVGRLRADGDMVLSLVATGTSGAIVGHVGFCRLQVESAGGRVPAVGLAPLAVANAHRRQGIGAEIVRTGLNRLTAAGETLVFVLGDPAYYARFGFALETARPYASSYAGPHFMALRLADGAPRDGTLGYPAAFDVLG